MTHLGNKKRKYRVKGLEQAADRLTFHNEQENREMSVAEYFDTAYGRKCACPAHLWFGLCRPLSHTHLTTSQMSSSVTCRLKFPGAPCLSVGSSGKPVWLPAEVCRVRPGQRKLKLDDKQTAEVRVTLHGLVSVMQRRAA